MVKFWENLVVSHSKLALTSPKLLIYRVLHSRLSLTTWPNDSTSSIILSSIPCAVPRRVKSFLASSIPSMWIIISCSKFGSLIFGLNLISMGRVSFGFSVISFLSLVEIERYSLLKASWLAGWILNLTDLVLRLIIGTTFDAFPPTDTVPKSVVWWSGSFKSRFSGMPWP